MASWHFITSLWVTCLFLLLQCQLGEGIWCWDCNSLYDPRCGDPFDNYTLGMADCSQLSYPHLPYVNATMCRKSVQRINGKLRVIRSCGWLNPLVGDENGTCFQRSGSHDVYVTHCTCKENGCNTATTTDVMIPLVETIFGLIPLVLTSSFL